MPTKNQFLNCRELDQQAYQLSRMKQICVYFMSTNNRRGEGDSIRVDISVSRENTANELLRYKYFRVEQLVIGIQFIYTLLTN